MRIGTDEVIMAVGTFVQRGFQVCILGLEFGGNSQETETTVHCKSNIAWFFFALVCIASYSVPALAQKSGFETAAESVDGQVALASKEGRFELDFPDDRQTAQQMYRALSSQFGGGGGGGGSNTWNYRAGSIASETYFEIKRGLNYSVLPDLDSLLIQENAKPFRLLDVKKLVDRQLVCLASDLGNRELVLLTQAKDQPTVLFHVKGDRADVVAGSTISELLSNNKQLVSDCGSLFNRYGLKTDFSGFNEALMEEMAVALLPVEMDESQFLEQLAKMKSNKFRDREDSTKTIAESFAHWAPLISKYARDEDQSPEVRSRLRQILDQNLTVARKSARKAIEEKSLLQEPAVLIEAWRYQSREADEANAVVFGQALRELTGQAIEDDLTAWEEWLASQHEPKSSQSPTEPTAVVADYSRFPFFAKEIASVCRLDVSEDGKLNFDRDWWLNYYGGKKPAELADELQAIVEEKKIPSSWITPGDNIREMQSQHLLMQSLGDRGQLAEYGNLRRRSSYNSSYSSNNIQFDNRFLKGVLRMTAGKRRRGIANLIGKNQSKFVQVSINEPEPNGLRIHIFDDGGKHFSIVLIAPASNAVVWMSETEDGFLIHDLRADGRFSVTAASYAEFLKEHREYFDGSLKKTLDTFCIALSESAGGTTEFESLPLEELKKK